MGEQSSYGSSLGCLNRRYFLVAFCAATTFFCAFQLGSWIGRSRGFDVFFGLPTKPEHEDCTGSRCYEVFSCFGMKDTTEHLREPLFSATGLVVFPIGAYAAHHCLREPMRWLAVYLAVLLVLHAVLLVLDAIYFGTCDAYPSNAIYQSLARTAIPLSPLSASTCHKLWDMTAYPKAEVDRLMKGFAGLTWHLCLAGFWVLLLAYVAWEARTLGNLFERGPLGLGVHYGLGQWDEIVNRDIVRLYKEKEMRSQFMKDAEVSVPSPFGDEEPCLGYRAHFGGDGYGAAGQR